MVFLSDTRSSCRTLADAHNCLKLYFLRHGIAAPGDGPKYKDDSLRPLTAEGREKIRYISLGMKRLKLSFDIILSSPHLRARQTAEIVAQSYKINRKKIHITKNLLPPASIEGLLNEVHAHFQKSENVLFVGHEPHLTEMISCLLTDLVPGTQGTMSVKQSGRTQGPPLRINLKKGGLCHLSIQQPLGASNAIMNWLLTPSQLVLMAR